MAANSIDRSRRVAGLIQRELSDLIASELGDPRVVGVTITDVKVTKDLRQAEIFASRLDEAAGKPSNGDPDEHEYIEVLNKASGFLRRQLGKSMSTKVTPTLEFKYDDTIDRGFRISELIDSSVTKDHDVDADGPTSERS